MKCPECGSTKNIVIDTRATDDQQAQWRRRKCEKCGKKWYTTETTNGDKRPRTVVLCEECEIHGRCIIETALEKIGTQKPYCSAGKARNDSGKNKGNT